MTMQGVLRTLRSVHHVVVRVDGPREVRVDLPGDPIVLVYAPVRAGRASTRGSEGRVLYGRSTGASERQPVMLDGKHVDAIRCIWPKARTLTDRSASTWTTEPRVLTVMVGMPELELETDGPDVARGAPAPSSVIHVHRSDTRFMDAEERERHARELAREIMDSKLLDLPTVDGTD